MGGRRRGGRERMHVHGVMSMQRSENQGQFSSSSLFKAGSLLFPRGSPPVSKRFLCLRLPSSLEMLGCLVFIYWFETGLTRQFLLILNSLYRPDWPLNSLQSTNSASWALGSEGCTTAPRLPLLLSTRNQAKGSSVNGRTQPRGSTYTKSCFLTSENEGLLSLRTQSELEDIVLSEMSQAQKDNLHAH